MKTKILQNKKILFFSPSFFSYENEIKDEMEKLGADVKMYDERSVTSSFARALLKVFPWFFYSKTHRYYRRIIEDNKNVVFDYILVVRCDMVTDKVILLLRKHYPSAKLCLHLWDSLKNVKGIKNKLNLFDWITSFDRRDCLNDKRLSFRPLFYVNSFSNRATTKKEYDLCFCGTIHSDRFVVLTKIFEEAKKAGLKTYLFAYLQSRFIFYYYKMFRKGFRKAKIEDFCFQKKRIAEISNIEKSSRVVLDIQHPKQTGLTMRTIEMIGANTKIITTNEEIKEYDFYNPANILVIDRKKPNIDLSFFYTDYQTIPYEIQSKYCLKQWIIDVLGETR